jgi:hypothetical protein
MKQQLVRIIAKIVAILMVPFCVVLWSLFLTAALGLMVLLLAPNLISRFGVPVQAAPSQQSATTLILFVLLAVPICSFWTFISVQLWRWLWPDKFSFTKIAGQQQEAAKLQRSKKG